TNRNIYTSPDGNVWTQRSCGVPVSAVRTITSVAYGSGRFVAVNDAGRLFTSTSGATWTTSPATVYSPITYCRDRFIARTQAGANLVSLDGLNWSLMIKNVTNDFGRVRYGHGRFLALSGDKIFSSIDATNWVQHPIALSAGTSFSDIAFGERNAVLIANENPERPVMPVAFVSDPFVALEITQGFPRRIALSGLEGLSYRIEYSDALQPGTMDWRPLATFVLTSSPLIYTDITATASQRFYRAVLLPD
ncbi:MAG TPA: hypothetical protein VEC99_06865, partial [Clostridia bacterium]|nr:hypothetical protein [Clostridia bacterium]